MFGKPKRLEGMIDLHCHYVPGVDDGVTTLEESIAMCQALSKVGFGTLTATPHIKPMSFDNSPVNLRAEHARLCSTLRSKMPDTTFVLGAEHYVDDTLADRIDRRDVLLFPDNKTMLVEFSPEVMPPRTDKFLFTIKIKGITPLVAHPERYAYFFKQHPDVMKWKEIGVGCLLDVMSLTGYYGKAPKKAAERMLKEDLYWAGCSDSHRPSHAEVVGDGVDRLIRLVGEEKAHLLMVTNPQSVVKPAA